MQKKRHHKRRSKARYTGMGAAELSAYGAYLKARKYSPATIDTRQRAMAALFSYLAAQGCCRIQDISVEDLAAYRDALDRQGLNPNTCYHYLWCIKRFFAYLEETQAIFINPAKDLFVRPPRRRLGPVPTEEEMTRLLAQPCVTNPIGRRNRAMLEVMYSSGVRRAELLGMKLLDPDLDRGCIRVMGKGRKERVVPLGRQAIYWLKHYMSEARPWLVGNRPDVLALWLSKDGAAISGIRVDQMIRAYAGKAGIQKKISPHAIRRACATHMLNHGAHPVQLQMLLGHASIRTLSQYLQVGIRDMTAMHKRSKPGK